MNRKSSNSTQKPASKKTLSMADRISWINLILCFALLFSLFFLYGLKDQEVSVAERRKLRQFPEVSLKRVMNGQFQSDLEPYLADQMPMRSLFLSTASTMEKSLYLHLDDHGLISWHGHLISLEQVVNEDSLDYAAETLEKIDRKYLQGTDCQIYLSIIPDKAYFVDDPQYTIMDYEDLTSRVLEQTDFARYIDIMDTLDLNAYYSTDSHWNQTRILDTAKTLAHGMNITIEDDLEEKVLKKDFRGVYTGQSAWKADQDELAVLESGQMKDWVVTSYASGKPEKVSVYDLEKADAMDPYDVFLSGAAGLITIENPHGEQGRELVLFRDSFGLFMAPLLASGYEKTTIIDIRSLPVSQIGKYVDFTNQDVLFLYSTSVLNHSSALKQ